MNWLRPTTELLACRYFAARRPETAGWAERDWQRATGAALSERLGPALGEAVGGLGIEAPPACWAALTAARVRTARSLEVQSEALRSLRSRFDRAGVDPVILKGLATARHYPVPEVREASDIDLLVAPDSLGRADEALRAAGYHRHVHAAAGFGAPRHAVSYTRGEGDEGLSVELHPAWHEIVLADDRKRVQVGTASFPLASARLAGDDWRVLPATLELYLTAAHAVLHNPRTVSIYLDAAVLLSRASASELEGMFRLARAHGRERHLRHTASMAADLFGVRPGRQLLSLPRRVGMPAALRLGYLGFGLRFVPSAVVLELLWRRGWSRKLAFVRWLLGHGDGRRAPGGGLLSRGWTVLRGLRWLKGIWLRYRTPGSVTLRSRARPGYNR